MQRKNKTHKLKSNSAWIIQQILKLPGMKVRRDEFLLEVFVRSF